MDEKVNLQNQQQDVLFEKASDDLLRDALKKTYTERFLEGTRLYKIHVMLKKAKITHKGTVKN